MKRQVLKTSHQGKHFEIIYDDDPKQINPYHVKQKYYDNGWHTRIVEKYADMKSAVWSLYWQF